jgi:hypothetical protein
MAANLRLMARKMSTSMKNNIKHVTVIGGGLMGSGIAQVYSEIKMHCLIFGILFIRRNVKI